MERNICSLLYVNDCVPATFSMKRRSTHLPQLSVAVMNVSRDAASTLHAELTCFSQISECAVVHLSQVATSFQPWSFRCASLEAQRVEMT